MWISFKSFISWEMKMKPRILVGILLVAGRLRAANIGKLIKYA